MAGLDAVRLRAFKVRVETAEGRRPEYASAGFALTFPRAVLGTGTKAPAFPGLMRRGPPCVNACQLQVWSGSQLRLPCL